MCQKCGVPKCGCQTQSVKIINKYSPKGTPGRNARPIPGPPGPAGTSSVLIKFTAFVAKNGNDSTALVERLDKPFLTIMAATNAIATAYPGRTVDSRVRVIVFDGKYTENIFLKKFVDYDLGNIVLNGQITDNDVDLGVTNNGEWTNIIWGNARIYNESAVTPGGIVPRRPNTKILINCNEIGAAYTEAITFINGITRIHCNRIYTNDASNNYNPAIEMLQGVEEDPLFTASRLEIIGADISTPTGGGSSTIQFNSGAELKNQTLVLIDCRVKNINPENPAFQNRSAISFGVVQPSNGRLVMYDTVLYSAWGK
jgi:hypothetical protein